MSVSQIASLNRRGKLKHTLPLSGYDKIDAA
jgi:hypothetical protein